MSVKNVKVRLNLSKENDRKAYEYLQNAEVSYSKAVISAICDYMELFKTKEEQDAFLRRAIQTIQQVADETVPLAYLPSFMQALNSPTSLPEHTGETEETVLDFLDNFS